jgi:hypothetical protein
VAGGTAPPKPLGLTFNMMKIMKKIITMAAVGLLLISGLPLLVAGAVAPEALGGGPAGGGPAQGGQAQGGQAQGGPAAASGPVAPAPRISRPMLALYGAAASTCPGLPWTVLAGIGTVESDNGESRLPGVRTGQNRAGAEGPMQFEPGTFARYDLPVPPGGIAPPSPYDAVDAVYAAARMLCANGAGAPSSLGQAVFDYNHSGAYVAEVLDLARSYGLGSADPATHNALPAPTSYPELRSP